jgi:hypothetical protein
MSWSTGAVRARVSRIRPDSGTRSRLSVVPPRATTARSGPFVLLVAAILVTGLVGLLMLNLSMQKASFQLASLQDRSDALQTREQRLDVTVDRLSSSDRLTDEATRMGMVPNPNPVFLDLSNGKVIGDPAVAQPRVVPAPPTTGDSTSTDSSQTPDHATGGGDNANGDAATEDSTTGGDSSTGNDGAATHDGGATTDSSGDSTTGNSDSTTGHGDSTTGQAGSTGGTDSTGHTGGTHGSPDGTGRGR